MCWISRKSPKLLIAYKDKICYKLLKTTLLSPYRNYQYCYDKPNTFINLQTELVFDEFRCYEGYHSYASFKEISNQYKLLKSFDPNIYMFKCLIPKGSQYLVNEWKEIVSSNIIITNRILDI